MEIEWIEAFSALSDYRNYTRAAEKLCISQSALSHRILQLEKELGTTLFLRMKGKRTVDLTAAGESFLPIAGQYLQLDKEVSHFQKQSISTVLHVGCVETISLRLFPLFQKIIETSTNQFSHFILGSQQIYDELEAGNLDFGLTVRDPAGQNVVVRPAFYERHFLVGCLGSDRKMINPRSLDPKTEIMTDWGTNFRAWHESFFGFRHRPYAELNSLLSLCMLIKEGMWCILPASAAEFLHGTPLPSGAELKVYEIPSPPPDRICYKAVSREPRPSRLDAMLDFEERFDRFCKDRGYTL